MRDSDFHLRENMNEETLLCADMGRSPGYIFNKKKKKQGTEQYIVNNLLHGLGSRNIHLLNII